MMLVGLAICAVLWLLGTWQLWNIRVCGAAGPRSRDGGEQARADAPAGVSIIIPARNEERRLPTLLGSLAALDQPPKEIIVVDDHSSDRTADLAREANARVVTAGRLPRGWTGKCWACWLGARAATGSVLVFLDADTWLEPDGLAKLIEQHGRVHGLLSVQPYHVTRRAYEQLSAMTNVTMFMAVNTFTPLGQRGRPHATFGPCVVCERAEYFRVGGHKAVRGAVLEDYYLGKTFQAAGVPVTCLAGRGAISFQMYPDGFGHMVEGWTKTFGSGSAGTNPATAVLVAGWVLASVATASLTAFAAYTFALGTVESWQLLAIGLYAAFAAQIGWMLRRIGKFQPWVHVAYPLSELFLFGVFLRAVALSLVKGGVRWKGRDIATRAPRTQKRPPVVYTGD